MFRVTNIREISRSEIWTYHTAEISPTLRENSKFKNYLYFRRNCYANYTMLRQFVSRTAMCKTFVLPHQLASYAFHLDVLIGLSSRPTVWRVSIQKMKWRVSMKSKYTDCSTNGLYFQLHDCKAWIVSTNQYFYRNNKLHIKRHYLLNKL